jgi:hypothetical protein
VAGQYGGGKLFFQATDDTWRWRRHTGEFLHDSYWVQVVRYLMPTARLTGETTLAIRTDRRVYGYGDPVHVDVQVADPMLPANQREMKLVVERSGTGESGDDSVGKAAAPAMLAAVRVSVDPDRFEASFVPPTPGSFTIRAAEAPSREKKEASSAAIVRVNAPDLESRRPAANHQALQMIAAGTGGQVVPLDRLEETFGAIPDRSLIIPDDVEESLWDSKLVLSLFVLIAGCEWVLRKVFGLL